jgi:KRAB domain-containing zinc finger protein
LRIALFSRYDESSENLGEELQLYVIEIVSSPLASDEEKDESDCELDCDDMSMYDLFDIGTCDKNYSYVTYAENELHTVNDVNYINSQQEIFDEMDNASVCHRDYIDGYSEFLHDYVLKAGNDEDMHEVSSDARYENISQNDIFKANMALNTNLNACETSEVDSNDQYWSAAASQPQEFSKENIPDLSNTPENSLRETDDGFINVYSCSVCDVDFVSFAELSAHMKYHIPGVEVPKHVCAVCDRKFFTSGALEHHIQMRLCKPEKCEICEKICKNKNMLALHKLTHGAASFHPCQYCNRKFVFASYLEQHLIVDHIAKLQFLCKRCNMVFHTQLELVIHRKNHQKVAFKQKDKCPEYLCYICGDVFDTFRKLKYHEKRIHEDNKSQQILELNNPMKYICEVCGKIFKFPVLLKNHALIHQRTGEQFMCEVCGVVRKNKWLLKQHQISHSNLREHVCRVCHTAYKTSNALITHERNCHGIVSLGRGLEKVSLSFSCKFCNRKFTTNERLKSHARIHTGERPFRCKECDRAYRSRNALHLHQAVNHRIYNKQIKRVFTCHTCGKTFTSNSSLNMHLNIHTGERPFKCKICNKAFTHKGGLVQHIVYHTDMRSYVCALCGKAFLRNSHLKIHIQSHTGEKPHKCDVCGRNFSQLGDMRKHRLKFHSVS